jgi:single-stranded-DNA-specific exonuclease
LTNDFDQAKEFAKQLNKLNVQRRELEKEIRLQAFDDLKEYKLDDQQKLPFGICLVNKDWHQGVVGIVASKIVHHINRPTIVFSYLDELNLKGSARSIHGLNMRHVLDNIATQNPGLITKFGGHAMAAGLTLTLANYEKFQQLFDAEVRKNLTEDDLQRKIITDGELVAEDLSLGLIELLRQAGPWGQGFPEPLFDNKFNILEQRLLSDKHLKLKLQLGDSKAIDAIAFNVDNNVWPNHRCEQIHAVYRPTINNYNGWESVQLIIEHLEAI